MLLKDSGKIRTDLAVRRSFISFARAVFVILQQIEEYIESEKKEIVSLDNTQKKFSH